MQSSPLLRSCYTEKGMSNAIPSGIRHNPLRHPSRGHIPSHPIALRSHPPWVLATFTGLCNYIATWGSRDVRRCPRGKQGGMLLSQSSSANRQHAGGGAALECAKPLRQTSQRRGKKELRTGKNREKNKYECSSC
jgi:hypothetical protein